jgi:NAD+ kinase
MKVALYGYKPSHEALLTVRSFIDMVYGSSDELIMEEDLLAQIKTYWPELDYPTYNEAQGLGSDVDLMVSFGGDGTMLRSVTYLKDSGVPLVGVNTGRLGFLSTLDQEDIHFILSDFKAGAYTLDERTLLHVQHDQPERWSVPLPIALNEVTVSRKDTTSMITIETYLDGEYLTHYWADGLIISTPTGSTGYSLSCGGPVVTPASGVFVITPIAPHHLNARPMVIPDTTKISLRVTGREKQHLVSMDSRLVSVDNEQWIYIEKAPYSIKMVEYASERFLKTLRKKMMWGEDKRN